MITWQIYLIAAVVFLIIEILNTGFGILCFSFGAVLAAIISACGLGLVWQLIAFAIGTFLSFLVIRPVLMKWLDARKANTKINLDSMVGRTAKVIEPVNKTQGRVAIDGTDWKAIADVDEDIPVGSLVVIYSRESNTLTVIR